MRIDFPSQYAWEQYLRDQPVPALLGYRSMLEVALDAPTPPTQLRLDMRTRTGNVPHHASADVVKSDYLSNVMSPIGLQKVVRKVCSVIKKSGVEFDSIAFRGFSGALVAPLVACRLKKGFLAVRKHKDNEDCHSSYPVEGAVKAHCHYIIIDDIISSGATVWNIVTELNTFKYIDVSTNGNTDYQIFKRKCVGVFLYNSWVSDKGKGHGFDFETREIHAAYGADTEDSFHLPVWSFSAK